MATSNPWAQLAGQVPQAPAIPAPPIDPAVGLPADVLSRSYKLRLLGSRRMITRDKLRELLQWLTGFLLNGQMMESLASQGQTVDLRQVFEAAKDATGVEWPYQFIRPFTQQEAAARQQPAPQVQAQMQAKQQELQTRMAIMQTKQASAEKIAQLQAQIKEFEISEESAWRIAEILQREKEAAMKVEDPNVKAALSMQELQMRRAQGEQELELAREKHQFEIAAQAQKAQQTLQQQQQAGIVGLVQSQQKHNLGLRQRQESAEAMRAFGLSGDRGRGSKPGDD